ncbi:hypothetical protein KEF85_06955 [Methylomonas paludis]|uniref:Inner membrane protein yeeR n=1 Tax=Methylomonas paludis TaxID=1173101 RepID=A0A975RAI3_9GAMM|nr:hypothetical protein [Methylomonas paludis]QWF72182.1 hypothetical protein KEF85_06955 [Methylomonas paludis]
MLWIILTIIVIIIAIAIIKKLAKLIFTFIKAIPFIVLGISVGPLILLGFIFERFCAALHIRALISIFLTITTWALFFIWGFLDIQTEINAFDFDFNPYIDSFSFDSWKFALPACLFVSMLYCHRTQNEIKFRSEPLELFHKKRSEFYMYVFSGFFLLVVSASMGRIFNYLDWSSKIAWYTGLAYYAVAVLVQFYAISQENGMKTISKSIYDKLNNSEKLNASAYLQEITKENILNDEDVKTIFQGIAAKLINEGTIKEIVLNENHWLFNTSWYQTRMNKLYFILSENLRHNEDGLKTIIENWLGLPNTEIQDFLDHNLDFGSFYHFDDGRYFVVYRHVDQLDTCVSCGMTVVVDKRSSGEWHCSTVCKETEDVCLTIKNKPIDNFMAEAATNGFVLMAGANAWNDNHKIFATGGQGHGFAAEQGNNKIDRLMRRDAQIIGGDNAKNGADRIVQGQQIQTKYCATGARSVGAAFDGQQGMYRYVDNTGKPMQLEVPRDQYNKAIETMENKIRNGKVPGITDPNDAEKLIRKGHLTYAQAQNITKFGTVESILYDISEGVVVGAVAGGISFGITSLIFYLNTKDEEEAFRVAVIQAGNTFGKTLAISITTQQLHRLSTIQSVLEHVDVGKLSPTISDVLQKGMGVSSTGINKALRGTLVTSVAVIAVTTGPDMIKLIRGRISQAQFFKNLVVVSSGMAGGVIGSVAGGFLFSPMGPVGVFFGRTAGGVIGGIIASAVSNKIANKLIEEDRVKMLRILQIQMEYLAITFMLTAEEIDNLNTNLDTVIGQKTLEVLFAAGNQRRAMANFFLKPVVVTIIKQRPALSFEINDVIDACDNWVV